MMKHSKPSCSGETRLSWTLEIRPTNTEFSKIHKGCGVGVCLGDEEFNERVLLGERKSAAGVAGTSDTYQN